MREGRRGKHFQARRQLSSHSFSSRVKLRICLSDSFHNSSNPTRELVTSGSSYCDLCVTIKTSNAGPTKRREVIFMTFCDPRLLHQDQRETMLISFTFIPWGSNNYKFFFFLLLSEPLSVSFYLYNFLRWERRNSLLRNYYFMDEKTKLLNMRAAFRSLSD